MVSSLLPNVANSDGLIEDIKVSNALNDEQKKFNRVFVTHYTLKSAKSKAEKL